MAKEHPTLHVSTFTERGLEYTGRRKMVYLDGGLTICEARTSKYMTHQ